jgi:hypothetical protein
MLHVLLLYGPESDEEAIATDGPFPSPPSGWAVAI